jgi:hypothetical protein
MTTGKALTLGSLLILMWWLPWKPTFERQQKFATILLDWILIRF